MRMVIHWEMGECHSQLHQYKKACESYKEALNEAKKVHGEKPHRDIATLLMNIGQTLKDLGDLHEATNIHHQALDMKRELFSLKEIPAMDVARQLNSLGLCQWKLGQLEEAIQTFKEGQHLIQTPDNNQEKEILAD